MDRKGKVLKTETVDTSRNNLLEFAKTKLDKQSRVAIESTTNAWGVVDILLPHIHSIVVSNPRKTKHIAEAKIKTDKVDAKALADLLRTNYLPEVWIPDEATRNMRRLMGRRTSLVQLKTGVKNRIHSVFHQLIIKVPKGDLFSLKNMQWLAEVELPEWGRDAVDSELRMLNCLEDELQRLDNKLAKLGYSEERVKLLMTLPGVGVNAAITLLAAIGDIDRFSEADKAASYIGLSPSIRQSANKCYHGPITKHGNSNARWMMIQAAQHVRNHPGPIGNFYRKLARKKGHNIAVVAAARKLVTYAYHMLKNNEPYRYAQPKSTETKLAALRVKATGKKRKGGNPKGQPRHKNYGSGNPTRYECSLDELCEKEGLPTPVKFDELATGEQKHLRASKMVGMKRSIHVGKRVSKKRK